MFPDTLCISDTGDRGTQVVMGGEVIFEAHAGSNPSISTMINDARLRFGVSPTTPVAVFSNRCVVHGDSHAWFMGTYTFQCKSYTCKTSSCSCRLGDGGDDVVPYMADYSCTFKRRTDGRGVVVTIPNGPLGTEIVRDVAWGEELWCGIMKKGRPVLHGQIKFVSWDSEGVVVEEKRYNMKDMLNAQHPAPLRIKIAVKDLKHIIEGQMYTLLTPITHFLTLSTTNFNVHNLYQLLSRNNFFCTMYNMDYVPPMKIYGFLDAVAKAIAFPLAQQQVCDWLCLAHTSRYSGFEPALSACMGTTADFHCE